jgi:methionyl-tRNA synthetase
MKQKILITSALLYANGSLHFGHLAGAYLPGDIYARAQRLLQNDVLYISGSDEYGVAITLSAEMAGRSPQEHIDLYHDFNKKLFETLNFSFDHYSRTTWDGHAEPVQQYFTDLYNNGFIEEKVTDQLYSEEDQRFLADRYVEGTCPKCGHDPARGDECPACGASYEATDLKNPRSKLTGSKLVHKPTKHWFLMLDKFRDRLLEWIDTKDWKPNVTNFIKGYIKDLHPRAITRDFTWGVPIPLPGTEGKVLYVWFDAPIGYVTATMEWDKNRWKDYWLDPETKLVHFIGKDNIPFHSVIFPAMTMGQNLPLKLVDELPANEFFNLEGKKLSKSEGWYIDLADFLTRYAPDQLRYTLAANAPETADSEFTWKDFQARCNSELLGKYGNLVNRVMVFAHKQTEGKIPEIKKLQPEDEKFLGRIQALTSEIAECYSQFKVRRACQLIMEMAQEGNTYFDHKQPWKEAKLAETHQSMLNTIGCCLECIKLLALTASPIIPETAQKVWKMLGQSSTLANDNWFALTSTPLANGTLLAPPEILFKKLEDEQVEQEIAALHAMAKAAEKSKPKEYMPLKSEISFDDFDKVDLRVGTITAAEAVEKSKKLLKLQIDLGFEKRQILSGIKEHYTADDVIGKQVIVVANLKPAKLMGIESQGMILAGAGSEALRLITAADLENGASVS